MPVKASVPGTTKAGGSQKPPPNQENEPPPPHPPRPVTAAEKARFDQVCAYNALGWVPTLTSSSCGNPPKRVPVNKSAGKKGKKADTKLANLCAINSLAISLGAARTLNEGANINNLVTTDDIMNILFHPTRWEQAYMAELAPIVDAGLDDAVLTDNIESYTHFDYLERCQISLLLRLINQDYNLNYRLGMFRQQGHIDDETNQLINDGPISANVEGEDGPIVWIFNYGIDHEKAGNSMHFVGYSLHPDKEDPELDSNYLRAHLDDITRVIIREGLYRITQNIAGAGNNRPQGTIGEFIFQRVQPRDQKAPKNHVYGRIGEDERRIGFIPSDSLARISYMAPRTARPSNTQAGASNTQTEASNTQAEADVPDEGTVLPSQMPTPLAQISENMEELVVYYATTAKTRKPKDKNGVNEFYWSEDEILVQTKPRNSKGKVEVCDVHGATGLVSAAVLEKIDQPWGITQVLPRDAANDDSSGDSQPVENYQTWTLAALRAAVRQRKTDHTYGNGELPSNKGPRNVVLPAWLVADDAARRARKDKNGKKAKKTSLPAGDPLDIRWVESPHHTHCRQSNYVLHLAESGSNHSIVTDLYHTVIKFPNTSLEDKKVKKDSMPDVPWGIRVPANARPSSLEYTLPAAPAGINQYPAVEAFRRALADFLSSGLILEDEREYALALQTEINGNVNKRRKVSPAPAP